MGNKMKKIIQIGILGLTIALSGCAASNADVSGHMEYQYKG